MDTIDFGKARKYADEFARSGRVGAVNAMLCGAELCRLYQVNGISQGGDRKSNDYREKSKPQRAVLIAWPELVARELGISDDTARRWMGLAKRHLPQLGWSEDEGVSKDLEAQVMELAKGIESVKGGLSQRLLLAESFGVVKTDGGDGDRLAMLQRVADGEAVEWEHRKEVRVTGGTEQATAAAREMLEKVVSGDMSASRAWAGLTGKIATEKKAKLPRWWGDQIDKALGTLIAIAEKGLCTMSPAERMVVESKVVDGLLRIRTDETRAALLETGAAAIGALSKVIDKRRKFSKDDMEKFTGLFVMLDLSWLPSKEEQLDMARKHYPRLAR